MNSSSRRMLTIIVQDVEDAVLIGLLGPRSAGSAMCIIVVILQDTFHILCCSSVQNIEPIGFT